MHFKRLHQRTRQTVIKCEGVFSQYSATKEPVGRINAKLYRQGVIKEKDTVIIKNIKTLSGELVRDHAWFFVNQGFDGLQLKSGDTVYFDAVWFDKSDTIAKLKMIGSPRLESKEQANKVS